MEENRNMAKPLNMTLEERKEWKRVKNALRQQKWRTTHKRPPVMDNTVTPVTLQGTGVSVAAGTVTHPLAEDFITQPQPLTATGGLDHQKVLDKLRALYRVVTMTEAEIAVRMLPTTDTQIDEALKAASLTREQVRAQGAALGSSGRKIALQRRAEAGELKAEEFLRDDLSAGRVTGCKHCDEIRQMSDDELKVRRAELQKVLDFTKPIDGPLPPTCHVAGMSTQEEVIEDEQRTSDKQSERAGQRNEPTVTAGEAERTLGITSPGPEAAGEGHAHVPAGPTTRSTPASYVRR
jgi:hypothetical protein